MTKAATKPKTPKVLKIAGQTVDLELPQRASIRVSISTAVGQRDLVANQQTAQLLVAGALGLCWPDFHRKTDTPAYHHNLLAYGADVFDFLMDRGAEAGQAEITTLNEIIRAGNAALDLVYAAQVRPEDLAKARGNSEDEEEPGSDGSSP